MKLVGNIQKVNVILWLSWEHVDDDDDEKLTPTVRFKINPEIKTEELNQYEFYHQIVLNFFDKFKTD